MSDKGGTILALVLAWALGLGAYIVITHEHHNWPFLVAIILFAIGTVSLAAGLGVTRRRPQFSVILISLWPLATIAIASSVTTLACWLLVGLSHSLDALPKSQREPLAEVVSGIVTGLAGVLILTKFDDKTSWLWPAAPTKYAFKRAFSARYSKGGTREFDAIHEQHVRGPGSFEGWGICSRFLRGKVLGGKN